MFVLAGIRRSRSAALGLALLLFLSICLAPALAATSSLPRYRYRNGEGTLVAFGPVARATRESIVKFNVNGGTVALGTVMATNGLVLTKASELKPGKLTCWLATEQEVNAEVLAADEEEDLALVRVHASNLKPIAWATEPVALGQWAVTPGIATTPHAVGIVSALPHRIRPQRAFIGVQFDLRTPAPQIEELLPGLGAEKAGLKPGDLILAVNDRAMTNREQVAETLRDFRAGQVVKLRIRRAASEFEARVRMMLPHSTLAEPEPQASRFERMAGELSQRAAGFEQAIEHDTVLQPWLCGGPLVNLEGKAIGLNIARASRVSTYALPPALLQRVYERLERRAASQPGTPLLPSSSHGG